MSEENRPYRYSVYATDFGVSDTETRVSTNDLDVAFIAARNELAAEDGMPIVWIHDEVLEIDIPLKVAS